MIIPEYIVFFSLMLFSIGVYGVLVRRIWCLC